MEVNYKEKYGEEYGERFEVLVNLLDDETTKEEMIYSLDKLSKENYEKVAKGLEFIVWTGIAQDLSGIGKTK